MQDVPYFSREIQPLRGDRSLCHRMYGLFGLRDTAGFETMCGRRVDTLTARTSWPQIYVRLFEAPVAVGPAERIRVDVERDVRPEHMFYAVRVAVHRRGDVIARARARLDLA